MEIKHFELETQDGVAQLERHSSDVTGRGGKGFPLCLPLVSV